MRKVGALEPCDVEIVAGIPTTVPARTLFDLAAAIDEEALEDALDFVVRRGLASLPRLRWTLDRLGGRGRPGTALMRRLLAERSHGYVPTHSRLAGKLARLIKRSPLPTPVREFVVHDRGRHVARADFAYPHLKIAIEATGFDPHQGRVRQQRDIDRRNRLTAQGWVVLEFTWTDVTERPSAVIDTIAAAIASRSAL